MLPNSDSISHENLADYYPNKGIIGTLIQEFLSACNLMHTYLKVGLLITVELASE